MLCGKPKEFVKIIPMFTIYADLTGCTPAIASRHFPPISDAQMLFHFNFLFQLYVDRVTYFTKYVSALYVECEMKMKNSCHNLL